MSELNEPYAETHQDDGGDASGTAGGRNAFKIGLNAFIRGLDIKSGKSEQCTGNVKEACDKSEHTELIECERVDENSGGDAEADAICEAVEFHAEFGACMSPASNFSIKQIENDAAEDGKRGISEHIQTLRADESLCIERKGHG